MRTNVKAKPVFVQNHNGLQVREASAIKQLRRSVLATMLFEDQFYEDGQTIADRIKGLVPKVNPTQVAELAVQARQEQQLRHIPLLLARELARMGKLTADTLNSVIQRADEISEFLAMYWKDGKTPIANQVKKGLAKALNKFNEYQLAKWDKNSAAISLRDVMFLTHANPKDYKQGVLFRKLANKELATPDTWETQLSAGADKGETFTRLMEEKKLGALAFLRNLRNMVESGVSEDLIRSYSLEVNVDRVLPFRYIAAARIMPRFEDMLEAMMFRSLATVEKLPGKTLLLVDVSGSMFGTKISGKSDLDRFDAAAALAMLCREICEGVDIVSFSTSAVLVPPRHGFALRDVIRDSQPHGGTYLGGALAAIRGQGVEYDRIIVFTDEQSSDRPSAPWGKAKGYVINVASYQNGINNHSWTEINGFSEACIDFIREVEKVDEMSTARIPSQKPIELGKWPFPVGEYPQ